MDTPCYKVVHKMKYQLIDEIAKVLAHDDASAELVKFGEVGKSMMNMILEKIEKDQSFFTQFLDVLNQVDLTELANDLQAALEEEGDSIAPVLGMKPLQPSSDFDTTVNPFRKVLGHEGGIAPVLGMEPLQPSSDFDTTVKPFRKVLGHEGIDSEISQVPGSGVKDIVKVSDSGVISPMSSNKPKQFSKDEHTDSTMEPKQLAKKKEERAEEKLQFLKQEKNGLKQVQRDEPIRSLQKIVQPLQETVHEMVQREKESSKQIQCLQKTVQKLQSDVVNGLRSVSSSVMKSKVVFINYYSESTFCYGSGFAVDSEEYILTCAHVVRDANLVNIVLNSGHKVEGEVTDVDESRDLAIIKLLDNGNFLPPFTFEDLDNVEDLVEDLSPVVAIGCPDPELTHSIVRGVISGLNRAMILNNNHMQLDIITHPGYSGGPLVNPGTGKVIAVISNSVKPGIALGIPSTEAEVFVKNANRSQTQYTLGVCMLTATPETVVDLLRRFGLPPMWFRKAVVLTDVWELYPAHGAGLYVGDMVVAINGQSIHSAHDVYKAVRNSSGSQLTIDFYRMSEWKRIQLTPIQVPWPIN